jgi:hypothetical protein
MGVVSITARRPPAFSNRCWSGPRSARFGNSAYERGAAELSHVHSQLREQDVHRLAPPNCGQQMTSASGMDPAPAGASSR